MIKQLTLVGAIVLLGTASANAATGPHIQLSSIAALPIVERYPYDENADADAAVAAAFARARKSHKRVLIDLGGNWCGDCIVLANVMQLPEMKAFIASHFEVAVIDVGRETKNLQIPARFAALEDARHMTPQGIADWLAQWAK
jgi:hypothetical protein